ncbi:TldD/PmbA family protein, partial [Candidatus Fermentibacteria bacterium]|nr:TldD/PmbA family protein [Candidatus Fermentibacteria bacterium]
ESRLERSAVFLRESVPVEPGDYTVIMSPFAAGIFAHESFGHKSEADFMTGDETMMREWAMGSRVGSEMLSIADDGTIPGTGYTPFDDEGTPAGRTWLVKNGMLSGRLHSASTAAALDEEATGNARSIGFEYEPIPRMTTTFIEAGGRTREQLFREVDRGIFVESVLHGSGLSTFTLAPSLAWMIRGGEVAEPVRIAVMTGSVMETLGRIDGLSDEVEIVSIPGGGCGKHEQYPLPVGFGGPHVRVRGLCVR